MARSAAGRGCRLPAGTLVYSACVTPAIFPRVLRKNLTLQVLGWVIRILPIGIFAILFDFTVKLHLGGMQMVLLAVGRFTRAGRVPQAESMSLAR